MTALMYHDIVSAGAEDASGFPGRDAASYKVTLEQFVRHLDAICRRIGGALYSENPPVALTFDDGGVSAMLAAEQLERRNLRGFFFITANYIGTPGFLTSHQVRDLDARGHAIGSHSCSHPLRIGHCPPRQLQDEWFRSRSILSDTVGHPIEWASVPGGDYAPPVAEAAARAGFQHLFTSEPTSEDCAAFGLWLHGRYTIRRTTSAATAASLAADGLMPTLRQSVVWNVKKLGKRVGGPRYLRLRQLVLRPAQHVRWGDAADRRA
jgi:peptidoglycan/xylan/chitin deacetylase (PgdA/CDA1 family)